MGDDPQVRRTVIVVDETLLTVGETKLSTLVLPGEPMILLLHGLAGHRGEWMSVIDLLAPTTGVLAPDQRGHGTSYKHGPLRVDRASYVADIVALVEQFAEAQVVVVGQSMGGIVATLFTHARPDLVGGLVLVEAGMESMDDDGLADLELWFKSWPEVFSDAAEAEEFFGTDARSTQAWVEGLKRTGSGLVARFDSQMMVETMRSLATEDRWSEWAEIDVPTRLIRGSSSMISDLDVDQMMNLRPHIELVIVDDAGHDVHLDQPEQLARIISEVAEQRATRP